MAQLLQFANIARQLSDGIVREIEEADAGNAVDFLRNRAEVASAQVEATPA